MTFYGITGLLGSGEKRQSLWLFLSFPLPGDIDSGYQFREVTRMIEVHMLHSYSENQLCDIVYGG